MRDRIKINKDLVPYSFTILLGDQWYELLVKYNKTSDLFTVTLYKDGELIATEPVIYGVRLFHDVWQPEIYPSIEIIPLDESGQNSTVSFENLGETVFLTIADDGTTTSDTLP